MPFSAVVAGSAVAVGVGRVVPMGAVGVGAVVGTTTPTTALHENDATNCVHATLAYSSMISAWLMETLVPLRDAAPLTKGPSAK
jgi:hypothetical protein